MKMTPAQFDRSLLWIAIVGFVLGIWLLSFIS